MKLGTLAILSQGSPQKTDRASLHASRRNVVLLHLGAQFAAVVSVLALWPFVDQPAQLVTWWLGLSASQALILGLCTPLGVRRHAGNPHYTPLRSYLSSAGALVGGGAWGALALVGPYHASPQSQAILFLVLCSVSLAGTSLTRRLSSYAAFIGAVLFPLFILLLVSPPLAMPAATFWLAAFVAFALLVQRLHLQHATVAEQTLESPDASAPAHLAMLENTRAAIVLSRGNRLALCNRRFAQMMHATEAELARTHLVEGFENRADWHHHARAATAALRRGGTYHGSTRLRRRDGSAFWAEITGQAVETQGSPPQVVWVVFDVTEQMAESAQDELHAAQLRTLIAHSADWYWQTDPQHRLTYIAHSAGQSDDFLKTCVGRKWWQFHRGSTLSRPHPEHAEVRGAFERREGFRNLLVELPNGSRPPQWLRLSGTPRFNEHGAFLGHHGMANDVTDEIRSAERIRHQAYHDALTGLPNRRLLTDRLTQAISRAQRYREKVGLLFVDLDDFRRINDLGGHAAGDQALLEIADRLRTCVRACDTVARLDCDEFVILLGELDEACDAALVASKVLSCLQEPLRAAPRLPTAPLSTSIGVATFPDDASTADALLNIADARMFRAKRRGGQRIECRDGAGSSALGGLQHLSF